MDHNNNPIRRQTARKSTGAHHINQNDPLFVLERNLRRVEDRIQDLEETLVTIYQ